MNNGGANLLKRKRNKMETIKPFFERMLPDLAIATAAAGVFVVLGVVILASILFENWFDGWRRRPASLEIRRFEAVSPKPDRANPAAEFFPQPAATPA